MIFTKKLKTALIAGCSVLCISSFAFASTADTVSGQGNVSAADTAQTQQTATNNSSASINEMFDNLTKQMVQENKMTQPEADALKAYLKNAETEFNQMTDEQKEEFIKEHKAMTPEERVAQISVKTGIDADRLVQIFADMKTIVESHAENAQA